MKPSMLSLLIAAGAFGASTVYLAIQLDQERTRADQVSAESQALERRIAELESLRAALTAPQSQPGPPIRDPLRLPAVAAATPPPGVTAVEAEVATARAAPMAEMEMEQSEAFRKMMRSQLRAQNKRLHADIGSSLGLTPEDTNRLIDLLTDQQVSAMGAAGGRPRAPGSGPRNGVELHQKQLNEVAELIGYDKIDLYKEYQESLPARMEVATIARQLEGVDLQLDDSQRERLVTALAEERKRIPAPTYLQGTSPEDHARALTAWQEDYQQRSETRVRSILSSDQLSTYEEYQQWTREMRAQFESRRVRTAEPAGVAMPAAPGP
jgi:hypothetical protein